MRNIIDRKVEITVQYEQFVSVARFGGVLHLNNEFPKPFERFRG